MEKVVLELKFKDQLDRSSTIKVDDPREDLSAQEIESTMTYFIESDVFKNRRTSLKEILGANLVTTTTKEYSFQ